MLSVASVGSASGAASYYAADNYYTTGDLEQNSGWDGRGSEELGLSGVVDAKTFEKILCGELPGGEQIAHGAGGHRPGFDLTFSAPKSVSLLALVGGDKRLVGAQSQAVKATMAWAESRLAEARFGKNGRITEKTGNLIFALFQHDTSRASDPQLHTHAVIANATKRSDGKWRALHNDKIWSANMLLGAIYHSEMRTHVEKLGYTVENSGKNGMFEIAGISRETITAWSQRNEQIRAIAKKLDIRSATGKGAVALRSRDAKGSEHLPEIRAEWRRLENERGIDFKNLIAQPDHSASPRGLLQKIRSWGEALIDRVVPYFRPKPEPLLRGAKDANRSAALASAYAVTAAVRHLGERQASFSRNDVLRESLNFAEQKASITAIENRVDKLVQNRQLIAGTGRHAEQITTPDMIRTEKAVLNRALSGQGAAAQAIRPDKATGTVQRAAQSALGFALSDEQLAAAKTIIASPDRIALVQGDAGTGKSTIFIAVNAVPEKERGAVFALAPQNRLVRDISEASGIETATIASFLIRHEAVARGSAKIPDGSQKYANSTLIVDEASMLSSRQMLGLIKISERLEINRLVLVGDAKQIPAIEAGRPFYQMQDALTPTQLSDNKRQRDPVMRDAVALLGSGHIREAFDLLGDKIIESPSPAGDAADKWLSLDSKRRSKTTIFTAGHALRLAVTDKISENTKQQGSKSITLDVRQNLNLTREQLRHISSYARGLQLDIYRFESGHGLSKGSYSVIAIDQNKRSVTLARGKRKYDLRPDRLHPGGQGVGLLMKVKETFYEGDKLIWTGNDKARNIASGESVSLKHIDGEKLSLEDANGRVHLLKPGDPMRASLAHGAALNMHRAQGLTAANAIAVLSSNDRMLNSRSLAYVLASRAKGDFTLFLDDKEKVIQQIMRNRDRQPSALEVAGEMREAKTLHEMFRRDWSGTSASPSKDARADIGKSTKVDTLSRKQIDKSAVKPSQNVPERTRTMDFGI